jgi:hypothetical protein
MAPTAGYPGDPAAMAGAGAYPGAGGAPQVPPRPENLAAWTDQNFLEALRDKDARILQAIDSRVKAAPGDVRVVEFLKTILAAATAQRMGNQQGQQPGYPGAEGYGNPGQAYPGGVAPGTNPGEPVGPAIPPQGNIRNQRHPNLAVDSLSLMVVEAATAYLQSPAVGAMTGKQIPGATANAGAAAGQANPAAPGTMPAAGADVATGYPGAEYPGGQYPGAAMGIGGAGSTGNGTLTDELLVEHIVEGLIQNNSPQAWETLYGISAQTIETPLWPSDAAKLVVKGLYRNIDKNPTMIEPILLAMLDGSAPLPEDTIAAALNVTARVSDMAADRVMGLHDPVVPVPGGAPGNPNRSRGNARNAEDAAMAGQMGVGAGAEMVNGMPMQQGMGGANTKSYYKEMEDDYPDLSDAALLHAAGFLWSKSSVDALVKRLNTSSDILLGGDIPAGGDFVRVAASVPNDRSRHAVQELFSKVHATGANELLGGGFFKDAVHDPGMLVVLKSLPRAKPSRSVAQQQAPPDSWTLASQDLVLSLRDSLRTLAKKPGVLTPAGENFPVRLHKNAVAEFSGVLTLPGAAGALLKDAAPSKTTVYYARTSFTPQRPRDQEDLADHYESRTGGIRRADQNRGVLWIDGVKSSQSGIRRSMDVVIQAASANNQSNGEAGFAGAGAMNPGGAAGSFTVEIIVVEIADPKSGGSASDDASEKESDSEK